MKQAGARIVSVGEIRVGDRDRDDLGAIDELARSIDTVGLLHPIVVTHDVALVAGERRLAAVRTLGWDTVAVTVVDLSTAADVLRAEADENTCRKPLTPYEASRARERRAKVLAEDAAKRKAHGQTAPGRPKVQTDASSNLDEAKPDACTNLEPASARKTKNLGAIGTGYSGSTLDKVDKIRDIAEHGVIRQGKTQIPAPAPVREVARSALEDVKRSGIAVEPAAKSVAAALEKYVAEDPGVALASWRRNYQNAITRATSLLTFPPHDVAAKADQALIDEVHRLITDLTHYVGRIDQALPHGLHVVKGGAR